VHVGTAIFFRKDGLSETQVSQPLKDIPYDLVILVIIDLLPHRHYFLVYEIPGQIPEKKVFLLTYCL
jgi:hypothetical protein